jgi:hypothetical protein
MPYAPHHAAAKQRKATHRNRQKNKQENPVKHILQNMLWDSRKRSKKKGIEHTLTYDDLIKAFTPICPVTGVELLWKCGHGKPQENSPSLDRIDSTLGYTPDNIWIISYRINRIKNDATLEELQMLVRALSPS